MAFDCAESKYIGFSICTIGLRDAISLPQVKHVRELIKKENLFVKAKDELNGRMES